MAQIIQINENSWRIEDDGVRIFLLEGEKEALLIDTGMNLPNAREIAESITKKPLRLLNTHADPDHVSGNGAFDEFYMGAAERKNYHGGGTILPLAGGDCIDLGNRRLTIISLAGHTPGSIAVLDAAARVLIGGDAIQDGRIFMFGEMRDMDKYIETLKALWHDHADLFDVVYPSHGSFPIGKEIIPKLIAAAEDIRAGKRSGEKTELHGRSIVYYDVGCAGFLCEK